MQPGHLLKCRKIAIQRKQISTETLGKGPISSIFLFFLETRDSFGRKYKSIGNSCSVGWSSAEGGREDR